MTEKKATDREVGEYITILGERYKLIDKRDANSSLSGETEITFRKVIDRDLREDPKEYEEALHKELWRYVNASWTKNCPPKQEGHCTHKDIFVKYGRGES